MRPYDIGAIHDGHHSGRNTGWHSLIHFALRQLAKRRFSRHADEYGPVADTQLSQIREQLDIVQVRLTKPEARIYDDELLWNTRVDASA